MPLILGCIADDYTGASDLAGSLAALGLRTVQTIGVPGGGFDARDVDVAVVALKIRSAPVEQAVAEAGRAAAWLRGQGAGRLYYKICSTFDSTDSGNIGPVLEGLRADYGGRPVLVTPAFPETGRTVYLGHLFVGDTLLSESPLKDHPLTPMTDANLVRVLGRQCRDGVGLATFAVVDGEGAPGIDALVGRYASEGVGAVIADAVAPRHLDALGEVAVDHPLSVGATGLGVGIARALLARGDAVAREAATSLEPIGGGAAIIAGSCSSATLTQLAAVRDAVIEVQIDVARLVDDPTESDRLLERALSAVDRGVVLVSTASAPDAVAEIQRRFGRAEVGRRIEMALGAVAAGLVDAGVRRLIVAGGETSGAVIDALGVQALRIGPMIAPGVPAARAMGAREPINLALKSGNFGGDDFFLRALETIN